MAAALIVLSIGVTVYFRRLDEAARETASTLKAVRDSLAPLVEDARATIARIDALTVETTTEMQRIGRLTGHLEDLVEGKTVSDLVERTAASTRSKVAVLLEGLKEGIKTLRGSKAQTKEESHDEQ